MPKQLPHVGSSAVELIVAFSIAMGVYRWAARRAR